MSQDIIPHESDFLFYAGPDGKLHIDVFYSNETVWLTQAKMAELFDVGIPAISKHLRNIFEDGELREKSVVSILETTASSN
ncbi:MAG: hypothetical protein NUV80_02585 [Candidatus Berkelbacteria bacterium]|nr:hypothetical protein [Candidatus Berkelbacteria bacterium]